jgi:hypothetical protein
MRDVILEYDELADNYILRISGTSEVFVDGESQKHLKDVTSFRFICAYGAVLCRKEFRGRYAFWYAYKRFGRRVHKVYIAKHHNMTFPRLEWAVAKLYSRRDCEPYDFRNARPLDMVSHHE